MFNFVSVARLQVKAAWDYRNSADFGTVQTELKFRLFTAFAIWKTNSSEFQV